MKIVFPLINLGSGADIYFERLVKELRENKVEAEINYYDRMFLHILPFLKLVKKKTDADIIHTTAELGWVFKQKDKPLHVSILHIPNSKDGFNPGLIKSLYYKFIIHPQIRRSLKVADKIFAISEYTKKEAINLTDKPIEILYPPLDLDEFKPLKVKSKSKKFKLLFVGNLIYRKGADMLPEIMKKLGKEYVLYYTSGLRTEIPKGFKQSNMISLGKLSDEKLIREYNKCDAVLFPTRLEGFGYVVAEGMACGKPVISTNCSSIPEIMKNKTNGFLCKSGDVDDFVDKIKKLKENKSLQMKMSNNNLRDIKRFYKRRYEI